MDKILRKRIPRQLYNNWPRYLALVLIIIMSMYLIVSIVGAAEVIIRGTDEAQIESNIEDGQVTTFSPLLDEQIRAIKDKGVLIEKHFSFDAAADADGSIVRIFENRDDIDKVILDEGEFAKSPNEIVLEKRYCDVHDISIGDVISLNGEKFNVKGIGSSVDFDMIIRKFSDTAVDSVLEQPF